MKTKYLIFTLLVMLFGFTGCFGEKKEITQEEKNSIIAEAKSAYAGNRGALISGAKSGIYLKDSSGNVRLYGFEDFFNMTAEQESAFVANWGNCVADSSYIVFSDNKAATIKLVRDNNGSFTSAKTASTISVADTGYTKDSIVLDGLSGLKKYANGDGPRVTFSSESENVLLNTSLTLTTMDGAVIRYSENDSSVTTNSTQYTTAISINGAKVVRAKAYMTGWIEGTEYRKSYGITAKYKVIYNGNNSTTGSVSDSNSYSVGDSVIVAEKGTLDRECWFFKGWNTKADGSGTSYMAGQTLFIGNGDITLYAQWKAGIKKVVSYLTGRKNYRVLLRADGTVWKRGDFAWKKYMTDVKDITVSNEHNLVIKTDNSFWQDDTLMMTDVKKIEVGACDDPELEFIMILKKDGTLWSYGNNYFGQLGDGTTISRDTPQQIMTGVADFELSFTSCSVMVLKEDGSLWTHGHNGFGLGDETTEVFRATPQQVITGGVKSIKKMGLSSIVLKEDGSLWIAGFLARKNIFTQVLTGVKSIAGGATGNAFVLKEDGSLWGCGDNSMGQLGSGDIKGVWGTMIEVMTGVKQVEVTGDSVSLLKEDGTLFGRGNIGLLGIGDGIAVPTIVPQQIMTGVKNIFQEYYDWNGQNIVEKEDGTVWEFEVGKAPYESTFWDYDNSVIKKAK